MPVPGRAAALAAAAAGMATLVFSTPVPPARAEEVVVRVLRYGEMRGEEARGGRDPTLRDDTLSGVVPMANTRIVQPGSNIQARYCEGFGMEFQVVSGLEPGATVVLLVRNRHPRLTRPDDGAQSEEDQYEIRVGAAPSWIGFTFAETWSLVPGRWSFTLQHDDRTVAEQGFDVERARDPGSLEANGCATPVS